jgi:hypothetical protein
MIHFRFTKACECFGCGVVPELIGLANTDRRCAAKHRVFGDVHNTKRELWGIAATNVNTKQSPLPVNTDTAREHPERYHRRVPNSRFRPPRHPFRRRHHARRKTRRPENDIAGDERKVQTNLYLMNDRHLTTICFVGYPN